MCGIVGFTGAQSAAPILLEGLKKLEYRGYDSAGIAVMADRKIAVHKVTGRISNLCEKTGDGSKVPGTTGIGHTRWATHGAPTEENAHPHLSNDGKFAVVHNGIIENYMSLREELIRDGYHFESETDTEVIVHLIEMFYRGDVREALIKTTNRLRGSYALGVICSEEPGKIYAVREASPLILGIGLGENYFASDVTALVNHTRNVIYLEDGEFAELSEDAIRIFDCTGQVISRKATRILWDVQAAEKGGYEHFMLKEINEQGSVLRRAMSGRITEDMIDLSGEWGISAAQAKAFRRLDLVACGTSFYAATVAQRVLENYLSIDIRVDIASEYRYRPLKADADTLALFVSQSGETLDTLEALRHVKEKGAYTVAATKTFTAQLAALILAGLYLAKLRGELDEKDEKRLASAMKELPYKVEETLTLEAELKALASKFSKARDFLFLGRGISFPVALEGALKLKEISYIHAEAYAAGEMKHGPIALLDDELPVVVVAPVDYLLEKTLSNVQETRARKAPVIFLTTEGVTAPADIAGLIRVPRTEPELSAFLTVIPLQIFAYEAALLRGCNIDQPRNLAKSVTVE